MNNRQLNRSLGLALVVLSLVALGTVVTGYVHRTPPEPDEGAAAHIFQLAIVVLVPVGAMYVATANWRARPRPLRPIVIAGVVLALAFAGLWFLEHPR
jgi:uncharacterized membrane protein